MKADPVICPGIGLPEDIGLHTDKGGDSGDIRRFLFVLRLMFAEHTQYVGLTSSGSSIMSV